MELLLQNESIQVPMNEKGNGANVITLATITTPTSCPSPSSSPIDIVVAVDRSDSMFYGERIKHAQRVVRALYATLRPDDRLGLVTFGTRAIVRALLTTPSKEGKHLGNVIGSLCTDKTQAFTNIGDAITVSFSLFPPPLPEEEEEKRERAIILLTDGDATAGVTNLDELEAIVKSFSETGVRLHTFGFGSDHSSHVLNRLATVGQGHYAYMENEASMIRAFAATLGAMRSIVTRNIRLELSIIPTTGGGAGKLSEIHTPFPVQWLVAKQKALVTIPDISQGERRDILVTVQFRFPEDSEHRSEFLDHSVMPLRAKLFYDDKEMQSLAPRLFFCSHEHAVVTTNKEVARQVRRVAVAKAVQEALKLSAGGGSTKALEHLQVLAKELEHEPENQELYTMVKTQIVHTQQYNDDDSGSSHALESAASSLSQQRAVGMFGMYTQAQAQSLDEMSQYVEALDKEEAEPRRKKRRLDDFQVEREDIVTAGAEKEEVEQSQCF